MKHRGKENGVPKLKHIAITTQDVEKTAKFYLDIFGMRGIAKLDDPGTTGCLLSDGDTVKS
jgi:catechol 2,3-dioxygenase-like lactoylglutathione lyase family enzyme